MAQAQEIHTLIETELCAKKQKKKSGLGGAQQGNGAGVRNTYSD